MLYSADKRRYAILFQNGLSVITPRKQSRINAVFFFLPGGNWSFFDIIVDVMLVVLMRQKAPAESDYWQRWWVSNSHCRHRLLILLLLAGVRSTLVRFYLAPNFEIGSWCMSQVINYLTKHAVLYYGYTNLLYLLAMNSSAVQTVRYYSYFLLKVHSYVRIVPNFNNCTYCVQYFQLTYFYYVGNPTHHHDETSFRLIDSFVSSIVFQVLAPLFVFILSFWPSEYWYVFWMLETR